MISPAAASSPSNATSCWRAVPRTGKSHLAIAIARSCVRSGARGPFYNVVDLVNLPQMDFIVLDELGYLSVAQSGASFSSTS